MPKPKPRIAVTPLDELQAIAWQLQSLAEQADGPARVVLEQARDRISSIAREIYSD